MKSSAASPLGGLERPKAAPAVEVAQFAVLRIGDETFAADIMRIKGIINPVRITPVPRAPAFIEGVIELRGSILPVVDMRKRFELPVVESSRQAKYVMVGIEGRIVALVVDGVNEVIRVPRNEIRPAPPMAQSDEGRYFSGVCHIGGRIIMVVDLDAILSSSERITLSRLAAPPGLVGSGE